MITFTDSLLLAEDPNGPAKQLSPQVAITFKPSFVESQQSIHFEEEILEFLEQFQEEQNRIHKLNQSEDEENDEMTEDSKPEPLAVDSPIKQCRSLELNLQKDKNHMKKSIAYQLFQVTKQLKKHIIILQTELLQLKAKKQQNRCEKMNSNKQEIGQLYKQDNKDEVFTLSKKLKYSRIQSTHLKSSNKKLFQQIKQIRSKLQAQFEDLYRSQIKNVELQLLLEKEKHENQKIELQEQLRKSNKTIKALNRRLKTALQGKCELCRQRLLLDSMKSISSIEQNAQVQPIDSGQLNMNSILVKEEQKNKD